MGVTSTGDSYMKTRVAHATLTEPITEPTLCIRIMKPLRITRILLFILCIIGLTCQIIQLSIQYFSYETTTTAVLDAGNIVYLPVTVLCSYIGYMIDEKWLEEYNTTGQNVTSLTHDLTIEQQMKNTPDVNIMTKFKVRDKTGRWIFANGNESETYFKATKFMMNGDICYSVSLKKKHLLDKDHMSNWFSSIFTIYGFQLKNELGRMAYVLPILYYSTVKNY